MSDNPPDEETDDPFSDMDEFVPRDVLDDPFDNIETAAVDEDAVWEAIMEDELDGSQTLDAAQVEDPASAETVVRKEQFCKRCEHFSAPPECVCTYPESEIVEIVGVDRFRVRNCPVVASHASAKTVLPNED